MWQIHYQQQGGCRSLPLSCRSHSQPVDTRAHVARASFVFVFVRGAGSGGYLPRGARRGLAAAPAHAQSAPRRSLPPVPPLTRDASMETSKSARAGNGISGSNQPTGSNVAEARACVRSQGRAAAAAEHALLLATPAALTRRQANGGRHGRVLRGAAARLAGHVATAQCARLARRRPVLRLVPTGTLLYGENGY